MNQRSLGRAVIVRDLGWGDFQGWVDLYYTRYDEVGRNPDLGVYLHEKRPSIPEEAALFGELLGEVLEGNLVAVVAEADGKLVGTCTVGRKGRHLEDRHIGVLGIEVHPEHRGQGIGDALMRAALVRCQGRFETVELSVLSVNDAAQRLYRKHGFVEYGREPRSFKRGSRYLDDVLMSRRVASPE